MTDTISIADIDSASGIAIPKNGAAARCFHCGENCRDTTFARSDKVFCCHGCLVVHDLLTENGLERFYDLNVHPGVRTGNSGPKHWTFLDTPEVQNRLFDFSDGKISRITFHIPAIHCVACVWLLENLFRLHPGIARSEVNFPRREVAVQFDLNSIKLSALVSLLGSIGYEPSLTLGEMARSKSVSPRKRQWLQLGLAGFAFGNIMLMSLPMYFGLDSFSAPFFKNIFGALSLFLALPVLLFSAGDYWKSAMVSVRQRVLTLDVPIALGLAALYLQSGFEIISHRGPGYLDSMCGLIFFLLCGRAFQQKTHDRIAFDRDYKSFFPLSITRKTKNVTETVAISQLQVGDRVVLRNGELLPADAKLVSREACIDYSFVTGESDPVTRAAGSHLFAGGKQIGGSIEAEIVKPVSQSYLTSLWNHEAFQKNSENSLNSLTNRYSRRFTKIVVAVAVSAAVVWILSGDTSRASKAFASVLIVACPCALALAAPFALGTAQRWLAAAGIFLRNVLVIERLAAVDTIVFDKTGTLTNPHSDGFSFDGEPLQMIEKRRIYSLVSHSTHPHSVRIANVFAGTYSATGIESFIETPGCGIEGMVGGQKLLLGSRKWLKSLGVQIDENIAAGSETCLAIDEKLRGVFRMENELRPEMERVLNELSPRYEIALLSGDNERERGRFWKFFGADRMHFNKTPVGKLDFIRALQESKRTVMMIGDGLNDAGALKQSDVGVAVVEHTGAFSPASDIILTASQLPKLPEILAYARMAARTVRVSFCISAVYNLAGISIAAAGILSPLVCAVLMPLSSLSVVLFASGMATWAARRKGIKPLPVQEVCSL